MRQRKVLRGEGAPGVQHSKASSKFPDPFGASLELSTMTESGGAGPEQGGEEAKATRARRSLGAESGRREPSRRSRGSPAAGTLALGCRRVWRRLDGITESRNSRGKRREL